MTQFIIKTFDDLEYPIDGDDAVDLIEAWKGSDKSFPVDLGGAAISSSSIKSITPVRITEGDLLVTNHKQLQADHRSDKTQYKAARAKAESIRDIIKKKGIKGLKP